MIDIHTHILPMLDDGAKSVEQALDMLVMAYEDGIDDVVLTPHMARVYGFDNPGSKTRDYFKDLKRIVKHEGILIRLHLGMEYLYTSKESFEKRRNDIVTLNDSNTLLCEFFFDCPKETVIEAVDVITSYGYNVMIAHPERYECIQSDLNVAFTIKEKGAYLQMNVGSIFGFYGKRAQRCVYELLDENLIDVVGSDAHDHKYRTPLLKDGYEVIANEYGHRRAEKLFYENAHKILFEEEGKDEA